MASWHKHITEDRSGRKLTKLYGREIWSKTSSLTKDKCLENISGLCIVKKSTLDEIEKLKVQRGETKKIQNIVIEQQNNGSFKHVYKSLQNATHSQCPPYFKTRFVQKN